MNPMFKCKCDDGGVDDGRPPVLGAGPTGSESPAPDPRFASDYLTCGGCGGPHTFDTSIYSELWNGVIRANGYDDTLCLSCIVRAFGKAGVAFSARLFAGPEMFTDVPTVTFVPVTGEMAEMRRLGQVERECIQEQRNAAVAELREAAVALRTLFVQSRAQLHGCTSESCMFTAGEKAMLEKIDSVLAGCGPEVHP